MWLGNKTQKLKALNWEERPLQTLPRFQMRSLKATVYEGSAGKSSALKGSAQSACEEVILSLGNPAPRAGLHLSIHHSIKSISIYLFLSSVHLSHPSCHPFIHLLSNHLYVIFCTQYQIFKKIN